jgi:uncharacterized protein YlxP (DUF503 family)
MWIGWVELDLLLGNVHSLKAKRSYLRPLIADVRRRFDVSVGEVGHLDLHRRCLVGAAQVAADRGHVVEVLDAVENFVAVRPEFELLSARRGIANAED